MPRWIRWSEELSRADYALVGKKCANWGEMVGLGLPVPPAFALTVEAYGYFFEHTGLRRQICALLDSYGPELKYYLTCLEASRAAREVIEKQDLPVEIVTELVQSYNELSRRCGREDVAVSVRSSGPVSRPGQFETYLNVRGAEELCRRVLSCWSSTFTVQALAYRLHRDLPAAEEPIAVGVMELVEPRAAGVAFTADPTSGAADRIVIEGSWGLGESIVGGQVSPDRYVIAKKDLSVLSSSLGDKSTKVVAAASGIERTAVDPLERYGPCLLPQELECLARLSLQLEDHFGVPQDVEWAVTSGSTCPENIYLLQTRPVAGLAAAPGGQSRPAKATDTDQIIDLMLRHVFRTS